MNYHRNCIASGMFVFMVLALQMPIICKCKYMCAVGGGTSIVLAESDGTRNAMEFCRARSFLWLLSLCTGTVTVGTVMVIMMLFAPFYNIS